MTQETAAKPKTIKVKVTFPISPAGPLHGERPATETVGALRELSDDRDRAPRRQ